ncbi:hypothetical protein TIFTF001_037001 [Ficus carica]|uniref:Uncharacterized protein n=1 Tax=Ficus carica TaxID=3494 RepID=A0AA88E4Q7_FICCA|nr:hypothetical protein TIFTF001_037001 [Ficus carica]
MAYRSSLLLIAAFLVAATSVANGQILATVSSVAVARVNSTTTTILRGVNVTLACNQTAVARPVTTDIFTGFFTIFVPSPNATLVRASRCALFTNASVGSAPPRVFNATIIPLIPEFFPITAYTSSQFT